MRSVRDGTIPAIFSIDVEPDAFQIFPDATPKWRGHEAAGAFAGWLRDLLTRRSASVPRFGWYLRMDPQIEQVFGRADAAAALFPARIAQLKADGDYLGLHMHPLRWSAAQRRWLHDFHDQAWLRHCTHFSLDAFEQWSGTPATLFRAGAGFLGNDIVSVLADRGVEFELSLEPVPLAQHQSVEVGTGVDSSPIVGQYLDCENAPDAAYRPDPADFRQRDPGGTRSLHIVPLTAGPYSIPRRDWWSRSKRTFHRFRTPLQQHLYNPASPWQSAAYFWDLVAHRLSTMPRPYLSLAIRTDAPDSVPSQRIRSLFAALAHHPLGERLRFVEPREALLDHLDDDILATDDGWSVPTPPTHRPNAPLRDRRATAGPGPSGKH